MFKYRIILDVTKKKKMTGWEVHQFKIRGKDKHHEEKDGSVVVWVSGCKNVKVKNTLIREG